MVEIIPGISESDWDALTRKVALVAPFTQWIHLNVSDGSMGTPETLTDVSKLSEIASSYPELHVEVHLLTANPEKYVRPLADAGVKRIIAHVESNDPRLFLESAKFDEVEVGLALDGTTEIEQLEPFLEEIDFVSIMTAEAGVSGGTFLPEAVEKIKLLHQNYPDLPIEVVGGITDQTVKTVKDAGATRIVAGDYIFHNPATAAASLESLKSL